MSTSLGGPIVNPAVFWQARTHGQYELSRRSICLLESTHNLCAAPDYRRRGLGTRLLHTCEWVVASEWALPAVHLHVDMANDAARALYTRAGYEPLPQYDAAGSPQLRERRRMDRDGRAAELAQPHRNLMAGSAHDIPACRLLVRVARDAQFAGLAIWHPMILSAASYI